MQDFEADLSGEFSGETKSPKPFEDSLSALDG